MAAGESPILISPSESPEVQPPRDQPRMGHWSLNLIGISAFLGLCYYGELVLAVLMVSILLAFILAPIVDFLTYFRLPRALAAAIAVLLLIAALVGTVYYSSNQALVFAEDLPKYTTKIREEIMR